MSAYFVRHLQVLFSTLGDLRRSPITSFNTISILAITLLLPILLYVTVKSAQHLSDSWQGRPQISIFLSQSTSDDEAKLIFDEIRLNPAIAASEFITSSQALEEFHTLSGLQNEVDFLDDNPLPASIVVMPSDENLSEAQLLELKQQLSKIEGIDNIRLDLEWTNKFNAILSVVSRIALLLSGLLAFGLLLIVGNTIKLLILNRRAEIEITKLVGGTDAFVRRPFLYYGMLFGVFGALLSLILLLFSQQLVKQPFTQLSSFYQSHQLLYRLSPYEVLIVIGAGGLLGWLAARWSVAKHLRDIKPR